MLLTGGIAEAQTPAPQTVAATGSGEVRPEPRDRNSNASIRSAVERARQAAAPLAVADARRRAVGFGLAAGLRLGGVISITEPLPSPWGPLGQDRGTFGPGLFCGRVPRFRTERDASGRVVRRVRLGARRTCRIPSRVTVWSPSPTQRHPPARSAPVTGSGLLGTSGDGGGQPNERGPADDRGGFVALYRREAQLVVTATPGRGNPS